MINCLMINHKNNLKINSVIKFYKILSAFFFMGFLCINAFQVSGQLDSTTSTSSKKLIYKPVDTAPTLGNVNANQERLEIEYNVPFPGVCEFKVYGPDSVKVYHQQYITARGGNHIRIKTSKLKTGKHTFTIGYKGHLIESEFNMP